MTMTMLRLRSFQAARPAEDAARENSKKPRTTEGGDDDPQRRIRRSACISLVNPVFSPNVAGVQGKTCNQ